MKKGIMVMAAMISIGLAACGQAENEEIQVIEPNYEGIATMSNGGRVSVHDPSIEKFDGKYYIFGSHMTGAVSEDMRSWTMIGDGYRSSNPIFADWFAEDAHVFDYAGDYGNGSYAVWAEDIIYIKEMQKYVMYTCTSSTYIKSNLCYATSDSPEGPYVWQGPLLYSGFTSDDIDQTDVLQYVTEEYALDTYLKPGGAYENNLWPNCIDPAPFYDEDGRLWMTYGSWSGGIFLIELDPTTGTVIHPEADPDNEVDPYFGKRLMGGKHRSIEGPYIEYDKEAGYYYLYVSYGGLAQKEGYQIRVFRSETVDGPYVDMNGEYPNGREAHFAYGLKLSGNYYLPSLAMGYMATGGQSTLIDDDGKRYICYHTRFEKRGEMHEPAVKQILINKEGWPVLLPYNTKGETVSETGYDKDEVVGDYFFINQGLMINDEIAQPVMITLKSNGKVTGSIRGTWTMEKGTYYMTLEYNDKTYSGVFCKMQDQAGVEIMTFSAVGSNESIWGVKY
ncbi:MAG: glycoside hydrolase family 43 protein [Lachnospiraceae bacterium]|jgi:arabinan endo-1,5-alpha-L-arabinosidase|nr:glycoside hydrolase family 43 protein [Lachnospiraceae bacterium]